MDLDEVPVQREVTHRAGHFGLKPEEKLVFVCAEVDPAVIQTIVHTGTRHAGAFLGRRDLFALDGQCCRQTLDPDLLREHFQSVQLHVLAFKSRTHDRNDGVARQSFDGRSHFGQFLFLDRDLKLARDVLQHDEGHRPRIAEILYKTLHQDFFIQVIPDVSQIYTFHFQFSFYVSL